MKKIKKKDIKPRNPYARNLAENRPKSGAHKDLKKETNKRVCREEIKEED